MEKERTASKPLINDKRIMLAVVVGAVLILLIAFGGMFKPKEATTSKGYQKQLQTEVTALIEQIDGVGEAEVMVTLDNAGEVKGVLVVCEGGNSPIVEQKVTAAVKTVLAIGANNVCVVK